MVVLLEKLKESYDYIFYELADERTRDMFPSGWFLITILLFYLYFTLNLGPRLMRNVKPFKLRSTIFYYNLFQIFICAYGIPFALRGGWFTSYSYTCQPIDRSDNSQTRNMIIGAWYYQQIKLMDLMDTVFFVLRKKNRQISFLHIFHHFMMPIAAFVCLKYYSNGHGTLVGVINTIVHIFMYSYYLISGLGPKYQKYLWWKKYLTIMQIVQFIIIFIHNVVAINDSSCTYPKWISWALCVYSLFFMYMFGNFYYVNYIKRSKTTDNGSANNNLKQKTKMQ